MACASVNLQVGRLQLGSCHCTHGVTPSCLLHLAFCHHIHRSLLLYTHLDFAKQGTPITHLRACTPPTAHWSARSNASTRTHDPLQMSGNDIPPEYYGAIEKGFKEAANSGALIGAPVEVSRAEVHAGAPYSPAHVRRTAACFFAAFLKRFAKDSGQCTDGWPHAAAGVRTHGRPPTHEPHTEHTQSRPPARTCTFQATPSRACKRRVPPAKAHGNPRLTHLPRLHHPQPHPQGVQVVLTDGAAHAVDSSEVAFRIAAVNAFRCGGARRAKVHACAPQPGLPVCVCRHSPGTHKHPRLHTHAHEHMHSTQRHTGAHGS